MAIQNIQHPRGDEGVGAIVDGEGDFISGRGGGGQPRPVRPQPVAAWPQADGGQQQVIDDHGTQRPTPLRGFGNHGHQRQAMQRDGCAD